MTDLMNKEIESTETIVEDTLVENIPVDEEMMVENTVEMHPQRVNPFCIIAKERWANGGYDIQTNSSWSSNPDPDNFVVVPDDMVQDIQETCGFCDIILNDDGTEVVSFTALEKPVFPESEPVLTAEQKRIAELEEQVANTENALIEIYEMMEG